MREQVPRKFTPRNVQEGPLTRLIERPLETRACNAANKRQNMSGLSNGGKSDRAEGAV